MAVIGSDHKMTDAGLGEFTNPAGDVPEHRIHGLAGRVIICGFPKPVDRLSANDNERGARYFLCNFRREEDSNFVNG